MREGAPLPCFLEAQHLRLDDAFDSADLADQFVRDRLVDLDERKIDFEPLESERGEKTERRGQRSRRRRRE